MNNDQPKPFPWPHEALLFALLIVPFVYLAYHWPSLPASVPLHWNALGEADRHGERSGLITMLAVMVVLPYVLLLLAPRIDPRKKNVLASSKAFRALRMLIGLFTCCIALVMVYSAQGHVVPPGHLMLPLSFLLLAGVGNFFPALRSNYFIGIRTPWTIESEDNWRRTHRFGARVYFWGGLIGAITVFLIRDAQQQYNFFLPAFLSVAFIPAIYSYVIHRSDQQANP
jgi:uncharacterized membrane protein